jgi:hypothetical protein
LPQLHGRRIRAENVFDPEEFDSALDDLEVRLEQLHLRFERYFSGGERSAPVELRGEIDQQFAALLASQRNLGALARVRLTILHQRYDSYQQCWERLAARATSGAHVRGFGDPAARSERPPSAGSLRLSQSSSAAPSSFRSSAVPPPLAPSLTPPLGTPSSRPLPSAPPTEPALRLERAHTRPDSSRTIRDFKQPVPSDPAQTRLDLRPPFENPSAERPAHETPARPALPFSVDTSRTTPYLRLPDEDEPSAVNMERVREIHARLRASNTRPPSLERLAERLSETEAKLKALHGDRPVTFDVVLRDDGKAFVKPIVH